MDERCHGWTVDGDGLGRLRGHEIGEGDDIDSMGDGIRLEKFITVPMI